jgi:hypothetical protein
VGEGDTIYNTHTLRPVYLFSNSLQYPSALLHLGCVIPYTVVLTLEMYPFTLTPSLQEVRDHCPPVKKREMSRKI